MGRVVVVERKRRKPRPGMRPGSLHLDQSADPRRGRFAAPDRGSAEPAARARSRWLQLTLRQKAKQISGLVVAPAWPVEINGRPFLTYLADFAYHDHERGRAVIEDVVGAERDEADRLRRRAAELAHGLVVDEIRLEAPCGGRVGRR